MASALAAAPTGSVVFVEAGDYAGFSITQPVQILADSLGPVRVTGGIPVSVANIATPAGSVLLDGLEIQSSLQLTNVSDPILLHDVAITGAGDSGTMISGCSEVALQRFDTARSVGVSGSTLASWGSTFGTLDLASGSKLQHVDTNAGGSILTDGTSTNTPLSPGWPTVDSPAVLALRHADRVGSRGRSR